MLNFVTIHTKGIGNVAFHSSVQGKGKAQTDRLFEGLIKGFAKQSVNYINHTSEAPFAYTERQMGALIIPILDELSDAMLIEHPITRKHDRRSEQIDDHHGYIDYWIQKGQFQYVIELKHSFENINSGNITQAFHQSYEVGINQIGTARRALNKLSYYREGNGTFPMLLHIVPLWARGQIGGDIENLSFKRSVEEYAELISGEVNQRNRNPDLIGYWELTQQNVIDCAYEYEGVKTVYPGVIFLATLGKRVV